ncbi:MAG: Abi family protein [Mycoplasmataceae bacterium]|nr:Abi family protein [Mycoplasmataceae bacterium]
MSKRNRIEELNQSIIPHIRKRFVINDEDMDEVYRVIKNVNFEHFKPYYKLFDSHEKPSFTKDLLPLYRRDYEIRGVLFASVNKLEISIRTRFLYFLTYKYGDYAIWDKSIFKNNSEYSKYKTGIRHIVHSLEYSGLELNNGQKLTEEWCAKNINSYLALEFSQLGNLVYAISSLSDKDLTEMLKKMYDWNITPDEFRTWLQSILTFRNRLAHFKKIIMEDAFFDLDYQKYGFDYLKKDISLNKAFFNYLLIYKLLVDDTEYVDLLQNLAMCVEDNNIFFEYCFPKSVINQMTKLKFKI